MMPGRIMTVVAVLLLLSVRAAAGTDRDWSWAEGREWAVCGEPPAATPGEQLRLAHDCEERGDHAGAMRRYVQLAREFPDSPLVSKSLERLARCLFAARDYWTASFAIEEAALACHGETRRREWAAIQLRIAKELLAPLGRARFSRKPANFRHPQFRGFYVLLRAINHDPGGPIAAEAYTIMGEGLMRVREYAAAWYAFTVVLDRHGETKYAPDARTGMAACDSRLAAEKRGENKSPEPERVKPDEEYLPDPDETIGEMTARERELEEAEKLLSRAEAHLAAGGRDAARSAFGELLRRYPHTPQAKPAEDRLGEMGVPADNLFWPFLRDDAPVASPPWLALEPDDFR